MATTRRLLAVFLVGLLIGIAATTAAGLGFQRSMGVSVPSVSVSSDCGTPTNATGWAARVPNNGYQTVLLNHSISGPIANASLDDGAGEFRLTITTEAGRSGCHYDAAIAVPTGFDTVVVVHDGEEIVTVPNREGTNTRFWPLDASMPA